MSPQATARARRGFTLAEIMVVVVILGSVLLLVPANLYRFGARSRLENTANTLVAAVTLVREQAILDGHPVYLELSKKGYRFRFTNLPAERSQLLQPEGRQDEDRRERPEERQWLQTDWDELPEGVRFDGWSEREGEWTQFREDDPYSVAFHPDGTVEKGFAFRLLSEDLDIKEELRTITILVNGLTNEATALDGQVEMPPQRDENEFGK